MSAVKLMVLGTLQSLGETHGYVVYRQLNKWRADTWTSVKPGSIYHALTSLEKAGLIENLGTKAGGGPAMTSYQVTPAGHAELRILIEKALVSYYQEQFVAGVAWMHVLSRQKVIELAEQRLQMYQQTTALMRTLPRVLDAPSPDTNPEIIDSWTVLFDATEAWLHQFIAHLKAKKYKFADEK